ncbi:hypothetical protein SAMN02983003_3637 [Devosia enhydra]|uniref:Uncharacterized protein n=1 Tax=Devosia enhydra TaxID=665118 RepID=A0A1K2I2I8_9HYPH|nr:hypothetical protein [Devosia enhydra]SFZ86455.1 hypothetical protein SAMN02983003_3637 [Devosia enhydra]
MDDRKQAILAVLQSELANKGAVTVESLDLMGLAVTIDAALGGDGVMPGERVDDGKTPDELNASNDI